MEVSRQEYWSGLPLPSSRDLLHSGIKPGSPPLQADSLLSEPPGKPGGLRKSVGLCLSRVSTQVSPFQVLCFNTEDQLRLLIQSFVTLPVLLSNFRPNFQLWWLPSCSDPIDDSPPGSSVPGILQARTLEWVAISFSRVSSQPRDQTQAES